MIIIKYLIAQEAKRPSSETVQILKLWLFIIAKFSNSMVWLQSMPKTLRKRCTGSFDIKEPDRGLKTAPEA